MTDEAPDDELVREIGTGGAAARTAEATLCRRFAPRIRLYGLRHLRDEDRSRDLVQSVLLAVLQAARARRVEDPRKLERFVLGTCRNVALRMRETEARAEPLSEHLLELVSSVEAVPRVDAVALHHCFEKLDERAKKVVMLSFMEELSAGEVATALTTSAGNVRVVRHRALAALRQCLDAPREVTS